MVFLILLFFLKLIQIKLKIKKLNKLPYMENSSDIGNNRDLRGRAAEEGEKSRGGLLFVQKEIFRNPKRPMCAHHC